MVSLVADADRITLQFRKGGATLKQSTPLAGICLGRCNGSCILNANSQQRLLICTYCLMSSLGLESGKLQATENCLSQLWIFEHDQAEGYVLP